jgi:hypothetical protein
VVEIGRLAVNNVIVALGRFKTMQYEMRKPTAVIAMAVLAVITAFCPSLMCAPPDIRAAAHSCCPHSHHQQGSLPCERTSLACPYVLLQKAKAALPALALPPLQMMATVVPAEHYERPIDTPSYVRRVDDLYVRNRVLLI